MEQESSADEDWPAGTIDEETESEGEVILESDDEEEEGKEEEEKEDKREKDDGLWVVIGFVMGLNKNSQGGGFNFYVQKILKPTYPKKKKLVPRIFQIRRISALPTYCPWIIYELRIEKPGENQGCIHIIREVISCKYREIRKNNIKKYMVAQRTMTEDDEKIFEKRVKSAFRKVPNVIKCKADLKENMKDAYITEISLEILAPCFRCGSILSLLPYFSYTFISWMNDQQATAFLTMIYHVPHIFCFWDKLVSVAMSLLHGKMPIFGRHRDKLELDAGNFNKLRERLNDKTGEVTYDSRNPCWSIQMLDKAIKDFKRIEYDRESLEVIEISLRIYIAFHEEKNSFKNSTFDICKLYDINKMEDPGTIRKVDWAISFLSENKILCSKGDINDFLSRECREIMTEKLARMGNDNTFFLLNDSRYVVMDTNVCILEIELAALIREKSLDIRIYDCRDYADQYLSGIKSIINEKMMREDTVANTVWLSTNKVCARFMKKETGFEFRTISGYIRNIKKNKNKDKNKTLKETRAIVIDRVHKCSLLELVEIFRICPNKCIVYIFGDTTDYGPNSKRGTHHLMYELCTVFEHELMRSTGTSEMAALRSSLDFGDTNALDVNKLAKNKDLYEVIYKIEEKIYGKKKKRKHSTVLRTALNELNNNSYHIFCTSEADKDTATTLLLEKKNNRLYKKGEFMLWDKVTIMNDGNIGRIEKMWKSDMHGNKNYQVVENKEKINIYRSPYIFRFFGDTDDYNTSKLFVVHSEVDVLSKFSGASTDYVILIAGKNTSYTDIQIAAKYARKEVKILLLPEASPEKLYSYKKDIFNNQYRSDLKYKLSFFLR